MGGNPCYSLCWIILLFLIAWPISFIMAPIWLLLMPFEACCPIFSDINGFLEKFVKTVAATAHNLKQHNTPILLCLLMLIHFIILKKQNYLTTTATSTVNI
mmetsp:Transcript_38150/g.42994  ORF Transcript_38150/g.42994 Transcript_38150/m.42994 type:complete len:101 (+) Transcript_38150:246-548(+)